MLKKILYFFLIVCCVFLSCSCSQFNVIDFDSEYKTNYNNINEFMNGFFWFDNGNVYYGNDGFYNNRWFCKNNKGTKKLFTQYDLLKLNNCDYGQFNNSLQAYGNNIYTWFSTDKENIFYKYDKQNKKLEEIFRVKDRVHLWAVKDEKLIYSVYESEFNLVLYIYDLNSNENKIIAEDVLGFGIVGDVIINIFYNPSVNVNEIYQYNIRNSKNRNVGNYNELAGVDEDSLIFNFTKNKIVFHSDEAPKDLYVLNTDTSKVNKYSFPHSIQYISCFDDYAFVSLYNKDDSSNIVHINLNNGEYKTIKENIECELVHSISDNQAFIIKSSEGLFRPVEYILFDEHGDERVTLLS